jgi:hypothetical protein
VSSALCALAGFQDQTSLAPFSGSVTYNGKPLMFGGVTMQPVRGGAISRGVIQSDGTFVMTTDGKPGAPLGMNSVRVTCYPSQKPGAATASRDGEVSLGASLIPERYARFSSSGLTVEVKRGGNEPYAIKLSDR